VSGNINSTSQWSHIGSDGVVRKKRGLGRLKVRLISPWANIYNMAAIMLATNEMNIMTDKSQQDFTPSQMTIGNTTHTIATWAAFHELLDELLAG